MLKGDCSEDKGCVAGALTRRRLLIMSVTGVGAMASCLPQFAEAKKENRQTAGINRSALMICDFQMGIADQAFAKEAAGRAAMALAVAQKAGLLVVFTRVAFLPGYVDVSPHNKAFAPDKTNNVLPTSASHLIPLFEPHPEAILLTKDRFSAFSNNALAVLLRSQQITHLVIAGVTTSGVVLSTFCQAADEDYGLTILSDACADPQAGLHEQLMTNLFPRSASVLPVAAWSAGLTT